MATNNRTFREPQEREIAPEPLDIKHIDVTNKQGVHKEVPALHIGFAEAKVFIPYEVPPPLPPKQEESEKGPPRNTAEIEEWLERMEFLEEDLKWLLKLPHQKFWCQVAFDKLLHACLDSYLSKAPRYYDLHDFMVTDVMKSSFQRIHRLVFRVFLRMSTYKESKECYFTREGYASLIYQYFLFDIPKMMDLCTLYIHNNEMLLRKMIENIFKVQSCYNDDLEKAAEAILRALDKIEEKLGLPMEKNEDIPHSEPKKLNENGAFSPLSRLSWPELQDILVYLVDMTVSLSSFLEIYPPACAVFHAMNVECRIATFYEVVFPPLKKELATRSKDENLFLVVAEVKKRLNLAKFCLVKMFHEMLYSCCIQPLLELTDVDSSGSCIYVEELMQVMTTVVAERNFICKYQKEYPFEEMLELLSQSSFPPDPTRTDYILGAISTSVESDSRKRVSKAHGTEKKVERKVEAAPQPKVEVPMKNGDVNYLPEEGAAAGPMITGPKMNSLVTQIQDLLPDYGVGFVEACLEYFNYDTEKVINGILENSLPSSLKNLDTKLPSLPKESSLPKPTAEVQPVAQATPSLVSERKNIFDNDEFDVFNSDSVDVSRIHKGKRDKNFGSLTESKEEMRLLKTVCNRYDITADTYDDPVLYEDEYDDTYDEHAMGPEEPIEEDDLTKRRPFTIPRVLRTGNESLEELQPEEKTDINDELQAAGTSTDKDDPKQEKSGRTKFDVKGKPKGRGQDEKTLRNRSQKEKHKSSYANHNRRAQSDRKRAQGMIPT